jgi:CheY-like chemotaxis protein
MHRGLPLATRHDAMTTILHVEDDEFLASAVQTAFEAFGFSGGFLSAPALRQAERILAEPARLLDLVITDVELPDGTGLDVVRAVRSSPIHRLVPVLLLAQDADAATIGLAYALGANSCITKAARGRATAQVVRTIYDHWLRDVRLPPSTIGPGRTQLVISRAISIRSRLARHFMTIAERLGGDEGDFWMGVAQREGNVANLLVFLLGQVKDRELPDDVRDDLEAHHEEALRVLDELDELERKGSITNDDAFRFLLALSAPTDNPSFARGVGLLFPASPVAMAALIDVQATSFEIASREIEARTHDLVLRRGAMKLREKATSLRSPVTRELR